jgi:hypothetical protein
MLSALLEAQITLKRLLTLFFGQRRRRNASGSGVASASGGETERGRDAWSWEVWGGDAAQGGDAPGALVEEAHTEEAKLPVPGGHRAGYGRLGADAYPGAERVECRHEELSVGQRCPVCGQGRLYELQPGVEMRIDGHALLSAMRYELAKLRCAACGEVVTAPLPKEAAEEK